MSPLLAVPLLLAFASPILPAPFAAGPAAAQPVRPPPPFACVGAEALEDDVFEIPFPAGRDRLTEAARTNLNAALALLKAEPDRNACILGHAHREGGQQTSVQLAASRARAVREALHAAGLPESRLRSEARVAGFSRTTANAVARSVSIVVMPVVAARPEPLPRPPAEPPEPRPDTQRPGARPPEPPPAPPAEAPPRETTPPPPAPPPAPPRETTTPPPAPPAEAPPRETTPPPAPPPEAPPGEAAPGKPD
ncbi:hypothetical protein EAH89_12805 [Roseomonas nepalensis]|uniref:OmpA-like domain-containing protein n=1 Tax=Muricoccus nepalensis TaxID=1854500 RepID=A0A502G6B9_9PROT|nr:OmpA family protein [Roseomonas nepalensis]TPG56940.1 hypothetical protein EAH89_12805 [Roseomonas nepalensis]